MKEELNIAAILKEKPKNTKLWSCIYGDVYLDGVNDIEGIKLGHHGVKAFLLSSGKAFEDGEVCLSPSKQIQNWSKFAWKKGDVLYTGVDSLCIFDKWANDEYTKFYGKFATRYYCKDNITLNTKDWTKAGDDTKEIFIKRIEEFHNGKLNLSTLQIDKQPEFKDGDIVVSEGVYGSKSFVYIFGIIDGRAGMYAYLDIDDDEIFCGEDYFIEKFDTATLRLATDSEKQQLFEALAKENKKWNPDTLQIEDLPKKCEFKPMDWCLMRDAGIGDKWKLCQFGFFDEKEDFDRAPYNAIGGNWYDRCIPYNDQTKHLLGTTDEWKGGEENA